MKAELIQRLVDYSHKGSMVDSNANESVASEAMSTEKKNTPVRLPLSERTNEIINTNGPDSLKQPKNSENLSQDLKVAEGIEVDDSFMPIQRKRLLARAINNIQFYEQD